LADQALDNGSSVCAGGSSDVIARVVAEGLRNELGQSVIVENISGAGGMIGVSRVAKAAPDGYQFVLGNVGTHAQNQSVYKKPLYNAATDFAPVGLVADQSLVLLARKDFPADDLQGFIAYAKANQEKLQYGSSGVGGSNHLACVLFNAAAGIDAAHVPYRSGGQAMQDLIAGRLDYQCPSAPVALPQIDGKDREGDRTPEKEPLAEYAGLSMRARAGADRLRHPELVCALLAQGHAPRDSPEAAQSHGRRPEDAVRAERADRGRLRSGPSRAPVGGVSRQVCPG
jgi:hypothetical protein